MDLWRSLTGMQRVTLTCADPAFLMERLVKADIDVREISPKDAFSVSLCVQKKDLGQLMSLSQRYGFAISMVTPIGIFWRLRNILSRPILLSGILILTFLACFLPSRIYFVDVAGNETLSEKLILEAAEGCGIRFGASRRDVRSEKMKNALLETLPQLQWAGVNTSGCVATILVSEKDGTPKTGDEQNGVSSIVARHDGVIISFTVTKGTPLCRIGQAVNAGQTLISGYTDCGIMIQATQAKGEIMALTDRTVQLLTPLFCDARSSVQWIEKKYSLRIGKKLINFYEDSGIYDGTCAKMYSEKSLTLPGDFKLPIALITETWICYETAQSERTQLSNWVTDAAKSYLKSQMVAGKILSDNVQIEFADGVCVLRGQFACMEMIGKVRFEESMYNYGKINGKDR